MKIAVVLPLYWPIVGGCELHTHEVVRRLSARHDVQVLTLMSRQQDKTRGGDFWFACMLSAPPAARHYRDGKASVTTIGLRRWEKLMFFPFLRLQGPRVPRPVRRLAMAVLVRFYRWKLRAEIAACDLIHAIHGDVAWISKAALLEARSRRVPFVFTPVSHLYHSFSSADDAVQSAAPLRLERLSFQVRGAFTETWLETCRAADALIAMTSFERGFFLREAINPVVYTVGIAPIVAERVDGSFRTQRDIGSDPVVLFLGRNNRDKGVLEVLQATAEVWRSYPQTRFVFVGPLEWGIEREFQARSDRRILVLGTQDMQQKSEALAACDILCVPSVVESLGGIYLEAWHYGKPIIAADIPPLRDLTENGQGGVLVKTDAESVARAIIGLIRDPECRERLGSWGCTRVQKHYSWDAVSARLDRIYRDLLREP